MYDVEYLFDNQLIAAIENLINEANKKLLLVSPFIDLDARIKDALSEKKSKHDFDLKVLYGKNEDNCYKSIKKDSLDFLKQFPNIEIRFNSRLHAKFYQNDFDIIMTSLNLYDYSLANNIEVGIKSNYAMKGLLGKVLEKPDTFIADGIDNVAHNVFGRKKDVNPIEKFAQIFEHSELKYKTEPQVEKKGGLSGMFGSKELKSFNVITDNFNSIQKEEHAYKSSSFNIKSTINISKPEQTIEVKKLSASNLSKSLGVTNSEIIKLMETKGFIKGNEITATGKSKGLEMRKYMGNNFIAFPEDLKELRELK